MPPTQVYLKSEVDKYIAELLKGERKLRRKLWLARATADLARGSQAHFKAAVKLDGELKELMNGTGENQDGRGTGEA